MSRLEICGVEAQDWRAIREFVELPFRLYRGCPQWVPPFRSELRKILRRRHPLFDHSEAAFYLARRDRRPVGRITVFENRVSNSYRNRATARFHHFECTEDPEAAALLFESACQWASGRGHTELTGPYGLSEMDGGGILIHGYEHRASMTMMPYHPPYYRRLVEANGFRKERDHYTARLDAENFQMPEKIRRVAEIHYSRGRFRVPRFKTKKSILSLSREIGEVYNRSFASHDDFCPLSEQEIDSLARDLVLVTSPSLVKILFHEDRVVGFLFAFPDLSAALQRARGRLHPLALADILTEGGRTDSLIVNGAGILPEYQKLGGNGLLYYELVRTVRDSGYKSAEMVQIADTTTLMLSDMRTLGGEIYKTHRVYHRKL
jgi:hypothetical protein